MDYDFKFGDEDFKEDVVEDTAAGSPVSLQQELLQNAVDDLYNAYAEAGETPSVGRDTKNFELDRGGKLRLKTHPDIDIINKRTGKPLALSTIYSKSGGGKVIREGLGFTDWKPKQALPAETVAALQTTDRKLGEAAAKVESVPLQDLGQTATDTRSEIKALEKEIMTILTDNARKQTEATQAMETTLITAEYNLREIQGLDKALQTIRGELVNNLAKLSELDEHIAMEERKLRESESLDESTRRRITERLRNLQDERTARLEAASASRQSFRSQINRIRETIHRILNEDTTLAERIRTLFREQGITLVSIITAIGMAISTLVVALTGGVTPTPTPTPPKPDGGGLKDWIKKHLKSLGRILSNLAIKAMGVLPGIIGSIVSWILNTLAKTAAWAAEHLWAVAVAGGSFFLLATYEFLTGP